LCPNIQYTKITVERICILMIYGEVQVYVLWILYGVALSMYCRGLVERLNIALISVLFYHWFPCEPDESSTHTPTLFPK